MIPVKIELHNFLAYHDPDPLDLTGIHVACLAGQNGAGKSSLLDAITWALWGKARAERINDLIHMHGRVQQTEMSVTLTFRLANTEYQVKRWRSSKGAGASELELKVKDGDRWRSITESSIYATQEKITRLLHLEYETFVNSAYLRQGQADEFTRKTPSKRKEILGEILGIDSWRRYEDKAKDAHKQTLMGIQQADGELENIQHELNKEPELLRNLETAQADLDRISGERQEAEAHKEELDQVYNTYQVQLTAFQQAEQRAKEAEADLGQVSDEVERIELRLKEFTELLDMRQEIEIGYATLVEARQQERVYSTNLVAYSDIRSQLNEVERTIELSRTQLEAQLESAQQRLNMLQRDVVTQDDYDELDDIIQKIEAYDSDNEALEQAREQLGGLREERAGLTATNTGLRSEMLAIKEQKDTIEATTEPECPLCGQELSEDHKVALVNQLQEDGTSKGDLFRANKQRMDEIAEEEAELNRTIADLEPRSKMLPPLLKREATLRQRIDRAEEAAKQITELEAEVTLVQAQLEQGEFAQEEQSRFDALSARLDELTYDESTHKQLQSTITQYQAYETQHSQLDQAARVIEEAQERLDNLAGRRTTLEQRMSDASEHQAELSEEIDKLSEQLTGYDELVDLVADLRDQEGSARHRVGAAEQRLHALDTLRRRQQEVKVRREELAFEAGVFEELKMAFGRDGIPAMIIEAAIPEIEKEANDILKDMTDGRMHIQFDTQRENVKGGTRETLDIRISDELGTRDYGLYSGGEAFRVNFAIRLALSRLLARRAGTQLRTLIIDEGFGTQDALGRERLVQAINAIQKDFDLILVITHIEELKEAFPARIEITKSPSGSQIEVLG